MKRFRVIYGLVLLSLMLSSCLLTFHPIYTTRDVVFDVSLLGSYRRDDAQDGQPHGLNIQRLYQAGIAIPNGIDIIKEKGYFISFTGKDGAITSQFIAFSVILNGNKYIDFYPYVADIKKYGAYGELKTPMHAIYRIRLEKGILTLDRFNKDYLEEMITKKQVRIRHQRVYDKYVITASTEELQQYISKYGNQKEAYEKEPEVYTKILRS